jgi:hypothetical protein
MRTSLKVAIGAALVAIVVIAFALSATGNEEPTAQPTGGGSDGSTGDVSDCAEGVPDCDDVVEIPGGDEPVGADADDDPLATPVPDAQTVDPDPDAVGLRARPFDSATVGDDGRTITIDFVSGVEPCYVLGRIDVDEGPNAVTITLFEGHLDADEDVACIDLGVYKRTTVTLDDPSGDRKIVDGAA